MKTSLAALLLTGLVAGCATQSTDESSPAPAPAPTAMGTSSTPRATSSGGIFGSRNAGAVMPQARSVYYEFDRSEIKADSTKVIDANAQYLLEHPELKVKVEGNADERGSREYNLALGQRRADAVQKRMTILGIPSDRIETVSYGKEKPKAVGHDESAWSENRRSDILYR
ncbi:MAG TPA: peptidoglycan-associated lipoprotein Pal [Burkholderiales bacterium]|nr:peptidoglycan-associated lipoprotein Pal [Burkholderiales bacterium]